MIKQELTDKYYKQNLCDSSCCCKLYNPLLTQGECHYYNEWCELKDKISDLEAKLAEKNCDKCIAKINDYSSELSQFKQQLAEKEKELVVKEQSRLDWKERANIYGDLIVSLNNFLSNKQKEEITFAKVIEDVKNLIDKQSKELDGRKKLCDLRYEQLKNAHQDKISFAVEQLNLLYKTLTTEDVWRAMKKSWWLNNGECIQLRQTIDNQIKKLKEEK